MGGDEQPRVKVHLNQHEHINKWISKTEMPLHQQYNACYPAANYQCGYK
jgi:hypothetical protein